MGEPLYPPQSQPQSQSYGARLIKAIAGNLSPETLARSFHTIVIHIIAELATDAVRAAKAKKAEEERLARRPLRRLLRWLGAA